MDDIHLCRTVWLMGCVAGADDIPALFKDGMPRGWIVPNGTRRTLRDPCCWNSNDVAHLLQTISVKRVKKYYRLNTKTKKKWMFQGH
jgi:hypothetical protein